MTESGIVDSKTTEEIDTNRLNNGGEYHTKAHKGSKSWKQYKEGGKNIDCALLYVQPEIKDYLLFGPVSGTCVTETLGFKRIYLSSSVTVFGMKISPRIHQPFGIVHGGINVCLCEEVASTLSAIHLFYLHRQASNSVPKKDGDNNSLSPMRRIPSNAVGLEINANHIRSSTGGHLIAVAKLIHAGQTTHIHETFIYNIPEYPSGLKDWNELTLDHINKFIKHRPDIANVSRDASSNLPLNAKIVCVGRFSMLLLSSKL